jgi:hypothetical protein
METGNQQENEEQPAEQVEITDNLTLLEQELTEDSLAAKLVSAYRDSDDPSTALTELADQRLVELREEYATPVSQDD